MKKKRKESSNGKSWEGERVFKHRRPQRSSPNASRGVHQILRTVLDASLLFCTWDVRSEAITASSRTEGDGASR